MNKKELIYLSLVFLIKTSVIYPQASTLDDNFFDNATQYDSSESVYQDDNYNSNQPLIDPNYVDPNFTPIAESKHKEAKEVPARSFGISFSQIADKTVKKQGSDGVDSAKVKAVQTKEKSTTTAKAFGFSFSQMANFTVDEDSPTINNQ